MQTKTVVKSILLNSENQILTLRRSETDVHRPGQVDLPGGQVEAGEDFVAAVSREVSEESGITITENSLQLGYAKTSSPDGEGVIVTRILYVGRCATENVKLSEEHSEYAWKSEEQVLSDFQGISWLEAIEFAIRNGFLKTLTASSNQ